MRIVAWRTVGPLVAAEDSFDIPESLHGDATLSSPDFGGLKSGVNIVSQLGRVKYGRCGSRIPLNSVAQPKDA